ncbi:HAD-IIIA family hydrolase [Patescibacteria group bacterium]|nr:HAD-IIIA family hydrolase [Patescibacteria group bacterium]
MADLKIRQAVILAGGKGLRLRPLTLIAPKPMVPIHGKPFLEYIIKKLKKNKIEEVLILVGYQHKKIENYFGNGSSFGLKILYSFSRVEANTGTRIRNAKKLLHDTFLLLYGDNYWPLNLAKLEDFYQKVGLPYLVTAYSNFDNSTKNNMLINEKGIVELYDKSRNTLNLNCVDIGFFILKKQVLDMIKGENPSFEKTAMMEMIRGRKLAGFITNHRYYSLTDASRFHDIEQFFKKRKIVFLDRDGVINKRPPKAMYITSWDEFKFLPKVKDTFKLLSKKGYEIYIISNQAGIARKLVSKKQVDEIHNKLISELSKIKVKISGIYICPHGWNEECFCRKPSPGLFFKAASENNINLDTTYCIGDDPRDIIAGKAIGSRKTFLVSKKKSLYSIVEKYL